MALSHVSVHRTAENESSYFLFWASPFRYTYATTFLFLFAALAISQLIEFKVRLKFIKFRAKRIHRNLADSFIMHWD